MFLARALSSWSQEREMKMKDLRLNEENWVALAACVALAVSVLIRLAATLAAAPDTVRPPNWGVLLRPARTRLNGLAIALRAKSSACFQIGKIELNEV
jgi:hypothetical protein